LHAVQSTAPSELLVDEIDSELKAEEDATDIAIELCMLNALLEELEEFDSGKQHSTKFLLTSSGFSQLRNSGLVISA
jgi:hypothetical protein